MGIYNPPSGTAVLGTLISGYAPPDGTLVTVTLYVGDLLAPFSIPSAAQFGVCVAAPPGGNATQPLDINQSLIQTSAVLQSGYLPEVAFTVLHTRGDMLGTGRPDVHAATSAQSIVAYGVLSSAFGEHAISNAAYTVSVDAGIPSEEWVGDHVVGYLIRYIEDAGIDFSAVGEHDVRNWIQPIYPEGGSEADYLIGYPTISYRSTGVEPFGEDYAALGDPTIEHRTRYYNLTGWASSVVAVGALVWDGKQYAVNVTLGDGLLVPGPIISIPSGQPGTTQIVDLSSFGIPTTENQVWPLHNIANKNRQLFVDGFNSFATPSPTVEQPVFLSIQPLGKDWALLGLPFVDQTIRILYADGLDDEFVSTAHQIYDATNGVVAGGFGSYVSGGHNVYRGTQRPYVEGMEPTSAVSADLRVEHLQRPLAPQGFDATIYGAADVQYSTRSVEVGGIPPLPQTGPQNEWRIPAPTIAYKTQRVVLTAIDSIPDGGVSSSHLVTDFYRWVDHAGLGSFEEVLGEADISHRYREVYPTFITSQEFGELAVKRLTYVYTTGLDSAFLSENAELLINTRRLYHNSTMDDFAEVGYPGISPWIQRIELHNHGWYDTQWSFPTIYNYRQEVFISPFLDNLNPDVWGKYYPFVDNIDREMRTFGHSSSRVGLSTLVANKGIPLTPEGLDATQWGDGTFIAYRNREVAGTGWDSFFNTIYAVVWNAAAVVAPPEIPAEGAFGDAEVINLNRGVKHHSGWVGANWGTPFIAYGVRSVQQREFLDVYVPIPEVRHNPFPLAPIGIPKLGQVGGHEARIFIREALPKSVNVHSTPWVGEPYVRNRNITVFPYAYEQTELGRHEVGLFIRYVEPYGVEPVFAYDHLVARRTKEIVLQGVDVLSISELHRIRNLLPDPPSPQNIRLDAVKPDGSVDDGFGIAPPKRDYVPHIVALRGLFPEPILASSRVGAPTVSTNTLETVFFTTDGGVGVPHIIAPQYVFPQPILNYFDQIAEPRISPHNIYAPFGDMKPEGYRPDGGGFPIGEGNWSFDGSAYPWFGETNVSVQHRTIGPLPERPYPNEDNLNGTTHWGNAELALRLRYIKISSIRSLRMGFPGLWGIAQYIDLSDPFFPQSISPLNVFGEAVVAYTNADPNRTMYAQGGDVAIWGNARVELKDRVLEPEGIPHRNNPEQWVYDDNPWGDTLVGYPRKYEVGMGVVAIWGDNLIEFKDRPVYPAGWVSSTLDDPWNLDNRRFPMKVTQRHPLVYVPPIEKGASLGQLEVTMRIRSVYVRWVADYAVGKPAISTSTVLAAHGWDSLLIGDIDRWEPGKLKPHGDDLSVVGFPRLRHPLRQTGADSAAFGSARLSGKIQPSSIPEGLIFGPTLTDPTGCTNRAVAVLPILPTQTVPVPVIV